MTEEAFGQPPGDTARSHHLTIEEEDRLAMRAWMGRQSRGVFVAGAVLVLYLAGFAVLLAGIEDADFFVPGRGFPLAVLDYTITADLLLRLAPALGAGLGLILYLLLVRVWRARALALEFDPHMASDVGSGPDRAAMLLGLTPAVFVLGLAWYRSMPAHDEVLTVVFCGLPLLVCLYLAWTGWRRVRVPQAAPGGEVVMFFAALLISLVGWCATEGSLTRYLAWYGWADKRIEAMGLDIDILPQLLVSADLSGVDFGGSNGAQADYLLTKAAFYHARCARDGIPQDACHLTALDRDYTASRKLADCAGVYSDDLREQCVSLLHLYVVRQANAWTETQDPLVGQRLNWCFDTLGMTEGRDCLEKFARYDAQQGADWLNYRSARWANRTGAELAGRDLRKADLSGARLASANLQGARLQGANLNGAGLQWANLKAARLQGADLGGARLDGANLEQAQMQVATLDAANLGGAWLIKTALQDASLIGAEMQEANLRSAWMQRADLTEARLNDALLLRTILRDARLSKAELRGANLTLTDLTGADLSGADMRGADLNGTRLVGVDLGGTDLSGALLRGAGIDTSANFTPRSLRGAGMRDIDLSALRLAPDALTEVLGDGSVTLPQGVALHRDSTTWLVDWIDWKNALHSWQHSTGFGI